MKRVERKLIFRRIQSSQLTDEERDLWRRWHQASPALSNPYFHPGFTQAVAAVRDDVEITIVSDADGPAAFFSYQRGRFGFSRPVGGRLSDFHGPISRPGFSLPADELIRGCGLTAWDFTHLPTEIAGFERSCRQTEPSPYVDLSAGFEGFVEERRRAGSATIKQTLRKSRKFEREVGPIHLEFDVRDPDMLHTMMEWKSRQYLATGLSDVFSFGWTRALMEHLNGVREDDFGGRLSALYAGESLIAIHFGMYSRDVLHYWFPVYDPQFRKYSPGLILMLELAREAAPMGRRRIDLGKGDNEFKHSMGPNSLPVAAGAVEVGQMLRGVRNSWRNTRGWLKTSPLGAPARATARVLRPVRDWLSFK